MTAEINVVPAIESVADFKAGLATWKPRSDEEAAKYIALRSIVSGKNGDLAKDAANARLIRHCDTCEELQFEGFKLKKVMKKQRIYNETARVIKWKEKIEKLKADMDIAKAELEAAYAVAGYSDEDTGEDNKVFSHWLVQ